MTIAQQQALSADTKFNQHGDLWSAVIRFPDKTPTVYTPIRTNDETTALVEDAVRAWKKKKKRRD